MASDSPGESVSNPSHEEHVESATGLRSLVVVYLKGLAMGAADTVPGVSGGTIALITGIYERFVRALTALDPRVLGHVTHLHRPDGRRALFEDLREMDLFFLVALGLGVVTAIVTLSRVVHLALVGYPAHTFAFFFGLIAASAVVLADSVSLGSVGQVGAAIAGFLLAFLVTGASGGGLLAHSLPVVFGAGAIGVTAMVLPGISGSFILLILGQYEYMTGALTEFVDELLAAVTGGSAGQLVSRGTVVVVFVAGAVVGLLTVAHLIRRALDRYRAATLAFLVSLMVGSLRLPIAEVAAGVDAWTAVRVVTILAVTLVGGAAVLLLDRYTDDLDY